MFGLVDWLIRLDEDCCALAVHSDSGVVVEDISPLSNVAIPPHLQMGLTSQTRRDLEPGRTHTVYLQDAVPNTTPHRPVANHMLKCLATTVDNTRLYLIKTGVGVRGSGGIKS